MKLYTADRETGTFIQEVKTVAEGKKLIEKYEDADKAEGTYKKNFYDVVDEDHISALQEDRLWIRFKHSRIQVIIKALSKM